MTSQYRSGPSASRYGSVDLLTGSGRIAALVLAILVIATFLFGGSSRGDTVSLILLRPLAFMALGYALWTATDLRPRQLPLPFWLLVATATVAAIQLVPLPPAAWHLLPGRGIVAAVDADVLASQPWRPLSLAPSRTLNSLLSLALPLATWLLLSRFPGRTVRLSALFFVLLGAINAILSLLQIIGPENSPLYFYKITNQGMAVGFFANRNHNAVFLASLVPVMAGLFLQKDNKDGMLPRMLIAGTAMLIIPIVFATGSRAGSALLAIALAGTIAISLAAGGLSYSKGQLPVWAKRVMQVIIPMILLAISYLFATSRAYDRFFTGSLADELRWRITPLLLEMVSSYFPFGSGFGTFYLIFKIEEPTNLLDTRYVNHAHNDLIQPLIEGGLPAAIIMLLFLCWLARAGFAAFNSIRAKRENGSVPLLPFTWLSLVILLAGSVTDYPLRTPIGMVVAAFFIVLITREIGAKQGDRSLD